MRTAVVAFVFFGAVPCGERSRPAEEVAPSERTEVEKPGKGAAFAGEASDGDMTPASTGRWSKFLPARLCGLPHRDTRQLRPDLVAARYANRDVTIHVNLGMVEDLESARHLYQSQYERSVREGWGVYTRSWTLDNGEHNREASIILRNAINLSLDVKATETPTDPVSCLLELDVAGLVALAAADGAPSGLGDLTFNYSEEQWKKHAASLEPGWTQYEEACLLLEAEKVDEAAAVLARSGRGGDIETACQQLADTRRDCKSDAFDQQLANADIHLTDHERKNFRRTWEITCELARRK